MFRVPGQPLHPGLRNMLLVPRRHIRDDDDPTQSSQSGGAVAWLEMVEGTLYVVHPYGCLRRSAAFANDDGRCDVSVL